MTDDNPVLQTLDRNAEAIDELARAVRAADPEAVRKAAENGAERWEQAGQDFAGAAADVLNAAEAIQERQEGLDRTRRRWKALAAVLALLAVFAGGVGAGAYAVAPWVGVRPVSEGACEIAGGAWGQNNEGKAYCVFWAP